MKFLRDNLIILFIYFSLFSVSLYFSFHYDKVALHIYLNQYVGNTFINALFFYITYLGDGRIAAFLLLIILLMNVRTGIYATFSFLSSVIISNLLKYVFFDDANRPHFIFQWINRYPIRLVEGVDLYIHNSFPSGHASQAFAVLMCLAFVSKSQLLKFLFLLIAVFTALSRVYLSQHWLVDITAGSFIGIAFSILYYFVFIERNRFSRLDLSLFALGRS
jgi:membrane-associated phospholipid phosphatase